MQGAEKPIEIGSDAGRSRPWIPVMATSNVVPSRPWRQRAGQHPLGVDDATHLGVPDDIRGPARNELDLAVLERAE